MTIVEKSVKYLLDQQAVNLYSAAAVLKEVEVPIQDLLILKKKECLKQYVMSVETNVAFLFSQVGISRYTAAIVLERKREPEAMEMGNYNLNLKNSLKH